MWDSSTGAYLTSLLGHTSSVTSLAFSYDGDVVVSGDESGVIRVWDAIDRGACLAVRDDFVSEDGGVYSVEFSPDGEWLCSGSETGRVRQWAADIWGNHLWFVVVMLVIVEWWETWALEREDWKKEEDAAASQGLDKMLDFQKDFKKKKTTPVGEISCGIMLTFENMLDTRVRRGLSSESRYNVFTRVVVFLFLFFVFGRVRRLT